MSTAHFCSIVFKSPTASLLLERLATEAGLPGGVLSIVADNGAEVGCAADRAFGRAAHHETALLPSAHLYRIVPTMSSNT